MILSRISIERPVFATVISLLLMVLGIAALAQLPVREYPDIDPPVVSITTVYPGASAEVIDREITAVIEGQVSGIEGIRSIRSVSRDEVSEVSIEFVLTRNLDAAASDVRDRLGIAQAELPEDAELPLVAKVSGDAQPIAWISLTSERRSQLELTEIAERNLTEPLSVLPGVARVVVGGSRRQAMRVWLDVGAMAAHRVTATDVATALRAGNVELPAGRVESETREFSVRSATRLTTPEEFAALVLRTENGVQLTLGQVARVEIGPESTRSAVRMDGQVAIGLGVVRQSRTNTLAVTDAVRDAMEQLRATLPPDVRMELAYTESVFIQGSINEVLKTLALAGLLVIAVIFLFLRTLRTTLVPAATIPVSLIASLMVLWLLDYSINTLTLLALVLAIGLVVDDTIVVLENVVRRHEQGEPRLLAAVRGTDQVGFAVIATTVVLVAVFVPLTFIPGETGQLFTEFGVTLAAAVSFSSLAALSLGAMLASKVVAAEAPSGPIARRLGQGLEALNRAYTRALARVVAHPLLVLLLALLVSALAALAFNALPRELTPLEDRGVVIIPVQGPEGATFAYTEDVVERIEAIIARYSGDDGPVKGTLAIIAPAQQGPAPVNQAFFIVQLKPWDQRDLPQQAFTGQLLPQLLFGLPRARAFPINPPSLGQGGFGEPIQVAVGGVDHASAARWGEQLLARMATIPGIANPRLDYNEQAPQLRLNLNRSLAADLGIDAREVGETLQTLFGGREITDFIERGEIYPVMVEAEAADTATPEDLARVHLRTGSGELISLGGIMETQEVGAPPELERVERSPAVVLTASLAPDVPFGDVIIAIDQAARETLPADARLTYLGQARIFQETQGNIALILGLALLIVFLVLAAQFESFLHPLLVMATVPLAFTGGLAALWLTGQSLNIYSQVGLLLLVGLATKNGILLVDFANQIRDSGADARQAAVRAGKVRLRPVLMTSIATVFGALPLALASGPGAEGRTAIGIAVIGGMLLSTLLTLFVIPAFYAVLAPFTRPGNWLRERLRREEQAYHPPPTARELDK